MKTSSLLPSYRKTGCKGNFNSVCFDLSIANSTDSSSSTTRRRIAAAQKKRWAEFRKKQQKAE